MPNPRRAYGRPGTRVIPTGWQAQHANVIGKTLPSTVTVGPRVDGNTAWNPATGQTETNAGTPVYDGPAAITAVTPGGNPPYVVDQRISTQTYEIRLPAAVDTTIPGLVVHVTDDPDPMLVGQTLTVDHTDRSTRRFSRILYATLNQ